MLILGSRCIFLQRAT